MKRQQRGAAGRTQARASGLLPGRTTIAAETRAAMASTLASAIAGARGTRSRFHDVQSYIEGMKRDPWLAVSQIRLAKMLMTGRWRIIDETTGKSLPRTADRDLPVIEFFERPNVWQTFAQFIGRLMIFRNITGIGYVAEQGTTMGGTPEELWVLHSARVYPVTDPKKVVSGYEYQVGGKRLLLPRDLVHRLTFMEDVDDELGGMGIVGAAETHFNTTIAMEEWIWSLFVNGAIPDGVLMLKETLDEQVFNRLLKQFEDRHAGARKAHKPMILENEGRYEAGAGPKEMDFSESRKDRRQDTLALAGMPPVLVGLTQDLNFASAFISSAVFIEDTYNPTCQELADGLLTPIARRFGKYRFEFPKRRPIADPGQQATRVQVLVQSGILTPNEGREEVGYDRVEGKPEMDLHYGTLNLIPLAEASMPAAAPAAGGPGAQLVTGPDGKPKVKIQPPFPADGKPGEKPGAPQPPAAGPAKPPATPPTPPPAKAPVAGQGERPLASLERATPLQRRILKFALAERRGMEASLFKLTRRFFAWQAERVIARLLEGKKDVNDVFDMDGDEKEWRRITRTWFGEALQEEYRATAELFGYEPTASFGPGSGPFEVRRDRLAGGLTRVSDTTRTALADVIATGIEQGLGAQEIANGTSDGSFLGIRGLFDQFSQARSQLIARTESARAFDQASTASYRELGVTVCDVIGCEDAEIMPGQQYGCLSKDVPIAAAEAIEFHPNHKGVIVPQVPSKSIAWSGRQLRALTAPDRAWQGPVSNRLIRLEVLLDEDRALDRSPAEVLSA